MLLSNRQQLEAVSSNETPEPMGRVWRFQVRPVRLLKAYERLLGPDNNKEGKKEKKKKQLIWGTEVTDKESLMCLI